MLSLALLQLGSAQDCEVVVLSRDQLKQEIKEQVTAAVEQAAANITDSLQQLLAPLLEEAALKRIPGKIPTNPAHSCKEIKRNYPSSSSGYYWIQSQEVPLVQVYCDMHITCLGELSQHAASSCKEIKELKPKSLSGYYWIKASGNSSTQVYCDMAKTCGGVTGGWMRVIKINMTNSSHTCPSGLTTLTSPKRLCAMNINRGGCSFATISLHGIEYTHVCVARLLATNKSHLMHSGLITTILISQLMTFMWMVLASHTDVIPGNTSGLPLVIIISVPAPTSTTQRPSPSHPM